MTNINDELLDDLEVHLLGCSTETEILPGEKSEFVSTYLPCGLPPILPDINSTLNSFMEDIEKLPIFDLDAVQRLVPKEPNIKSLYTPKLCPLPTELIVKRDMVTGKILGFIEKVIETPQGSTKTSTSLSRAPGSPDLGVKGSTSNFPFWPGGMDEPIIKPLNQEAVNFSSLFDGEYLDTPPGFKEGMKFERKIHEKIIPPVSEIRLSDVLAMDDMFDLESLENQNVSEHTVALDKLCRPSGDDSEITSIDEEMKKIANSPVLKISELKEDESSKKSEKYKWAVVENVMEAIDDFNEKVPCMAHEWPFELDIFQKKAIMLLEKHENVFIAAHTSAGKTVVAEYAIALAKKHMTRVIYTSPIKALSNQKFRDFKELFGDVGLITGDVQLNQKAFCLIMTTEILRSMLYRGSDVVREVEWVIFDEVHYINDADRGVVWEEVFIMLPDHVNLIMLSATVPNTAEFAEWLGAIKKRKIHVISTLKRPIPLEYYLYTGSVGETQDENFMIINEHGLFLNHMYNKAVATKKDRHSKSKGGTGPKGAQYNVSYGQDKNIYIGLLNHLKKKKLLPVVCFTLSRKKCKEHAEMLQSQDLTTKDEKGEIIKFFRRSISKLKDEDKELAQIKTMEHQLSMGFGVHHSGILPLLKEIVEMLFQKGLIKVLFATETFAMGVNMPARTVVFDSIQKHDGKEHRDLKPSEFIQMAGRAGRRGQDTTGTVIVLCKGDIPNIINLQTMMLGKPTNLESQFKLTYSMILNLLKVKALRVEDFMKRSFVESKSLKTREKVQVDLLAAKDKLSKLSDPDCTLCKTDLRNYCQAAIEITLLSPEVQEKICMQAARSKILTVGKVITFITQYHTNVPGVILNIDRESKLKILSIDKHDNFKCEDVPWTQRIYFPDEKNPIILTIAPSDVRIISNSNLQVDADSIIRDMKFVRREPSRSVQSAFDALIACCEKNRNGFSAVNVNIKDINFIEQHIYFKKLSDSLKNCTCTKCPEFFKHYTELSEIVNTEKIIEDCQYQMSEESLQFHEDFEARKKVLYSMGYIDANENVLLKGSVARELSNHELLVTELLVKSFFTNCTPEEIVALLSCTVYQQKSHGDLNVSHDLKLKIDEMKKVIEDIDMEQKKCHVQDPSFVYQYNFHLSHVVYDWAKGIPFAKIMQNEKVTTEEGIVVRCIQRLNELLKEVRKAANLVGDPVLAKKMEDASHMIKRDIVFAVSLYTQ